MKIFISLWTFFDDDKLEENGALLTLQVHMKNLLFNLRLSMINRFIEVSNSIFCFIRIIFHRVSPFFFLFFFINDMFMCR